MGKVFKAFLRLHLEHFNGCWLKASLEEKQRNGKRKENFKHILKIY